MVNQPMLRLRLLHSKTTDSQQGYLLLCFRKDRCSDPTTNLSARIWSSPNVIQTPVRLWETLVWGQLKVSQTGTNAIISGFFSLPNPDGPNPWSQWRAVGAWFWKLVLYTGLCVWSFIFHLCHLLLAFSSSSKRKPPVNKATQELKMIFVGWQQGGGHYEWINVCAGQNSLMSFYGQEKLLFQLSLWLPFFI